MYPVPFEDRPKQGKLECSRGIFQFQRTDSSLVCMYVCMHVLWLLPAQQKQLMHSDDENGKGFVLHGHIILPAYLWLYYWISLLL